jgi:TolB-like protein/DNA-binding winged helix-turn-helix (wHTH) protein
VNDLTPTHAIIRFSVFELDFDRRQLRKQGFKVRLQEQPFQVLEILLERPGEVVTRQELQRRIWPSDTFVDFDRGLYNAIKKLREALGDSAETPRFVETLSRRGYRFIGSVNAANGTSRAEEGTSTGEDRVPVQSRPLFPRIAIGAVLFLAFLATLFWLDIAGVRQRWLTSASSPVIHSLAVLPLTNLSNDPNQEYFSDGLTDALITDLAQIGSLKVTSRTSSTQYKQTKKSLPEIAHELNVDGIIEGTVQRSGDHVRITAQLIYGPSDKHLWANKYEQDIRDVLTLEREVTEDIARQVKAQLTTGDQVGRVPLRPMDPKALDAYLQGNYHLNRQGKGFGDEEKRKAAQYFEQAIAADPKFAPAYHALALAHDNLFLGSAEDAAARLKAAKKGAEVDPNYPDLRVTVAAAKWIPYLDWQGAESDLRRAKELDPRSPIARSALCLLLIDRGHVEEGLPECKIAQRLDPLDDDAALGLYMGRDYDGAIAMFTAILQGDNDGRLHCELFSSYAMKKMEKQMTQELQQCYALFGFTQTAANIGHAYETSGYLAAIRQWAKETEQLQATHRVYLPGFLVDAYAILGDKDRAFHWLEHAYKHREMDSLQTGVFYMGAEPMYDPLRSDPRFKDLLHRIGLSP